MTSTTLVWVIIILIFIYFGVSSYRGRQKRLQSFQAFAAQNGWTFVPNMTVEEFRGADSYALLNPLKVPLTYSSRRITAAMKKSFDGGEAFVFDYSYRAGGGKNERRHDCTVAAFYTPHLQLPYFALYPESLLSVVGELFGFNDIDFETHPDFSKRFKLSGKEELQLRLLFDYPVLTFFEKLEDISVDAGGNYLFIYRRNEIIPIESLNAFIDSANRVYGLFRR